MTQVISEWPIRSNRFQLVTGQHLLAATAALTTPVDVTAPVGYVPVHVTTGSGTPLTESANITISTLTPGLAASHSRT